PFRILSRAIYLLIPLHISVCHRCHSLRGRIGTGLATTLAIPARRQQEKGKRNEPTRNQLALAQRHSRTINGQPATTGVGRGRRSGRRPDTNHTPRLGALPPSVPRSAAAHAAAQRGLTRNPIPSKIPLWPLPPAVAYLDPNPPTPPDYAGDAATSPASF